MTLLPNTLDGLVRLGISEALFEARTQVLAKVTSWLPGEQAIQCKPLIMRKRVIDEEEIVDDYSILVRVPVSFPRWGGFVIRMPLAVDDVVMLLVSDRELERWLAGTDPTAVVEPRGFRVHSIDDACAYPGISPWASPIADLDDGELVIGREDGGGEIRVHADGSISLGSKDGTKKGVVRLDDQTKSDITTDAAFWAWVAAVDVALRALKTAGVGPTTAVQPIGTAYETAVTPLGTPTSETGKITSASSVVETE